MPAIDALFEQLRLRGQKAIMPFVTAGDPDLDFTAALIREFDHRGAAMCEIGVPYSDPIADGPVIQASYTRALAQGITLDGILGMLAQVKGEVRMPLVLMVSYAIVFRQGPPSFVARVKAAGLAGLIVPDLPAHEATELADCCFKAEISLIQLITPTTTPERAVAIAASATGFIYYVSVAGITGERNQLPADLVDKVAWLRGKTHLPICIGFGVSSPDHVRRLADVADGLIVGSAIVRRIAETEHRPRGERIREIGQFVGQLQAALTSTAP